MGNNSTMNQSEKGVKPSVLHDRHVQRRNFFTLVMDYLFFGIALNSLINPSVMPADFVTKLGGGPILVGLAGILFKVTWPLPQIFFAPFVNRALRKKNYLILPSIFGRVGFIIAGILIILIGPDHPEWLIVVMLAPLVMLGAGDGMAVVAWMDVLSSSVNNTVRSRMFGTAQVLVGIFTVIFVVPAVRFILSDAGPAFPNNYALLLITAGVLLLIALVILAQTKEGDSPPPKDAPALREMWPFLLRILRTDGGFRYYILTLFLYDLALIGVPFYIVFITSKMGQASNIAISNQIATMTITSIVTAVIMARINERYGPRLIVWSGTAATIAAPLLILSSVLFGNISVILLWVAVGISNATFVPGFLNWVVEYAPEGYLPIYSALANTFSALALLSPLLGGIIVQTVSYEALFIVATGLAIIGFVLALRLPEPRRKIIDTPSETVLQK